MLISLFYFDFVATCTTDFSGRNPVLVGVSVSVRLYGCVVGVLDSAPGSRIQLLTPDVGSCRGSLLLLVC